MSNYKIYANTRSKIAHRRWVKNDACREKQLNDENVEHYESFEHAKAEGFRACKRCKPDLVKSGE